MDVNQYNLNLILSPELSEEGMKNIIGSIEELVKKGKGEWGKVEAWGRRKFAYPIRKKSEGFYYVLDFSSGHEVVSEIEKKLKLKDEILRILIEKAH